MCLTRVSNKYKKPLSGIEVGWKAFIKGCNGETYLFSSFTYSQSTMGKVHRSGGLYSHSYEPAFHYYSDQKSINSHLKRWPIDFARQVVMSGIVAKGTEWDRNVHVARWMYVPLDSEVTRTGRLKKGVLEKATKLIKAAKRKRSKT